MVSYPSSPSQSSSPSPSLGSMQSLPSSSFSISPSTAAIMSSDQSLNALWSLFLDLSSTLSSNRDATSDLVALSQAVISSSEGRILSSSRKKDRDAKNDARETEEVSSSDSTKEDEQLSDSFLHPTSDDLLAENRKLRQQISQLTRDNQDLDTLVQQYESTLERVMDGVRSYVVCFLFTNSEIFFQA